MLLQLTPGAGRPGGGRAVAPRGRRARTDHFLGGLIGPPGETWVQVVTDAAYPTHVADVSLAALEVQPIDLLAILATGLDDGLTELTVRVLDTLRPVDVRENEPAPALRLELARHAEWPEDVRSLAETAALLEVAAQLVGRARAATPTDYQLAETVTATSPAADVAELAGRVGTAVSALRGLGVTLLGLLSDGADSDPALLSGDVVAYVAGKANVYRGGAAPGQHLARLDALWIRRLGFRSALLTALGFGITGVHLPTHGSPATRWPPRGSRRRRRRSSRSPTGCGGASAAGSRPAPGWNRCWPRRGPYSRRSMPVLPRFVIANPTELAAALTAQAVADPAVVADRWLAGVAPVRENLAALTTMTALADAFGRPTPTAVAVRVPTQPGEAWTGEALPERSGNRLSLTIVDGNAWRLTARRASPCSSTRGTSSSRRSR